MGVKLQTVESVPTLLPDIYTVGGTVQAGNGLYIARQADTQLFDLCAAGAFAYVLSSRQVGKSSLMIETARRLKQAGVQAVIIDLTAIGTQVTPESWYLGLLIKMEEQLRLTTDVLTWWKTTSDLGPVQRLMNFFQQVLLTEVREPIVIFIDEIDTTLSLAFTDDFFAAIRAAYNARATDDNLKRLSFVLVGVATPGDLIRDPARTPFNIGQRVELADFTQPEALPLAQPLGLNSRQSRQAVAWALDWTGGHPYLTQRLFRAMYEQHRTRWNESDIDKVVREIFLEQASRQDSHLQFIRDMLLLRAPNKEETLITYQKVLLDSIPVEDEEKSLVKSHLKLSGLVRSENGLLHVRNCIYCTVFDGDWIRENLPRTYSEDLKTVQENQDDIRNDINNLRRRGEVTALGIGVSGVTAFVIASNISMHVNPNANRTSAYFFGTLLFVPVLIIILSVCYYYKVVNDAERQARSGSAQKDKK